MVSRLLLRVGAGLLLALPGAVQAQDNSQQPPPPIYTLPGDAGSFRLPADSQPVTPKPVTPKPVTPKPAAPKPVVAKPDTPKPAAAKPKPKAESDSRPAEREAHRQEPRQEHPEAPPAKPATPAESAPAKAAPEKPAPPLPSPPPPAPPPVVRTPAPAPVSLAPLEAPPSSLIGGMPVWGWGVGVLLLGLIGSGAILSRRQRPALPSAPEAEAVSAVATETEPAAPAGTVATPPPPVAPIPPTPVGLITALRPLSAGIVNGEAMVRVEIGVTNRTGKRVEEIGIVLAMMSASPDQDRLLAHYQTEARAVEPSFASFTLVPGESRQLVADLALGQNRLHIVMHGDRPMFVPIVAVHLRWRTGLDLRSQGEAWMIGTGDSNSEKLGPFWFDRGDGVYRRVSARRYRPDAGKAATG